MELIEISQNDDLQTLARKCSSNFRQMIWSLRQTSKKQSRIDRDEIEIVIGDVVSNLVSNVIPNVVSAEVARQDIPTKVNDAVTARIDELDIPTMISDEVTRQLTPAVGDYVISDVDPSTKYPDTTWQSDTITTASSMVITIWKRTN